VEAAKLRLNDAQYNDEFLPPFLGHQRVTEIAVATTPADARGLAHVEVLLRQSDRYMSADLGVTFRDHRTKKDLKLQVERKGVEPSTSALRTQRSPN
jgi:hypothetical protein